MSGQNGGNLLRLQLRNAHIHPHPGGEAPLRLQMRSDGPRSGFQQQIGTLRQSPIMHIFGHTSAGVAAHFSLAAIRVEHAHFKIMHPVPWQN